MDKDIRNSVKMWMEELSPKYRRVALAYLDEAKVIVGISLEQGVQIGFSLTFCPIGMSALPESSSQGIILARFVYPSDYRLKAFEILCMFLLHLVCNTASFYVNFLCHLND